MTRPLADYDFPRLPTVTRLLSRPVLSFIDGPSVWEVGWNGCWVKRWKGVAQNAKSAPGREAEGA